MPRGQGWRGEPTHGRAHNNLVPCQRRALLVIPELGDSHQTHRPGLQLASTGSGHRRRDVATSRGAHSSCQHLGPSTSNECHAHTANKQLQRAQRLGAGPEDGGWNRVVAGRKTGHRCRRYFGPSFRSCQVEPMTCTSHCTLPNLHLRVGCHCPRQPLFSSAYPLDKKSALLIFPDEPTTAHIYAANFSHCWHCCHCPSV